MGIDNTSEIQAQPSCRTSAHKSLGAGPVYTNTQTQRGPRMTDLPTGGNILLTQVNKLIDWGRSSSLWPATFGLACCAIEMMSASASRWDIARFGARSFAPAASGGPDDRGGPRLAEDGAGAAADLRPDARAQVGDLDGRLRVVSAACSTTTPSSRAWTRSCRSMSSCLAAHRRPICCCMASTSCRRRSATHIPNPPDPLALTGVKYLGSED